MTASIPSREPRSNAAAQPGAGTSQTPPNSDASATEPSPGPGVPPALQGFRELSRPGEGVPRRSASATFASSAPLPSQSPAGGGSVASTGVVRTVISPDELQALLDSPESETVNSLVLEGPFKDSHLENLPRSVRHLTLNVTNPITETGLAHLENLPLRSLSALPYCQIGDKGAIVLGHHPTLESVILIANLIRNMGAEGLSQSNTLRIVDLSENSVDDEGGLAFLQSTSLEELLLYDNQLGARSAAALIKENRLRKLALGGNDIEDASRVAIEVSANTSLKFLDLSNCRVGNAELGAIAANRGIESLGLDGNRFDFQGLRMLAKNRTVKFLRLAENDRLDNDSAKLLARMTWLKELDVTDIEFGAAGFAALEVLRHQGVAVYADWPEALR